MNISRTQIGVRDRSNNSSDNKKRGTQKKSPTSTIKMKNCWSPWFYYDNTEAGSKACAATTIFFSTFSIIYICHCLSGGDSSQFFLPLFETDVDTSKSAILVVFYCGHKFLLKLSKVSGQPNIFNYKLTLPRKL